MSITYYNCLPVPEEIELLIMWWKDRMEQTDIRYRKLHKSHMEDVNRLYQVIRDTVLCFYQFDFVPPQSFIDGGSGCEYNCDSTIEDIQNSRFVEMWFGEDVYENYVPKTIALQDDDEPEVLQIEEANGIVVAYYENINHGKYVVIDVNRNNDYKNFNTHKEAHSYFIDILLTSPPITL